MDKILRNVLFFTLILSIGIMDMVVFRPISLAVLYPTTSVTSLTSIARTVFQTFTPYQSFGYYTYVNKTQALQNISSKMAEQQKIETLAYQNQFNYLPSTIQTRQKTAIQNFNSQLSSLYDSLAVANDADLVSIAASIESEKNLRAVDRLIKQNIVVAQIYDRISRNIQGMYTLINDTLLFIAQRNMSAPEYTGGAHFTTTAYTSNVAPIISSLNTLKNTTLPVVETSVNNDLTQFNNAALGSVILGELSQQEVSDATESIKNLLETNIPNTRTSLQSAYSTLEARLLSLKSIVNNPSLFVQ